MRTTGTETVTALLRDSQMVRAEPGTEPCLDSCLSFLLGKLEPLSSQDSLCLGRASLAGLCSPCLAPMNARPYSGVACLSEEEFSCQLYAGVTSLLAPRKSAGIGGLHLSVDALWWLPGLTGNALGLSLFYLPQRRLPTRLTEEPWLL